jgi:hypothetical protein
MNGTIPLQPIEQRPTQQPNSGLDGAVNASNY